MARVTSFAMASLQGVDSFNMAFFIDNGHEARFSLVLRQLFFSLRQEFRDGVAMTTTFAEDLKSFLPASYIHPKCTEGLLQKVSDAKRYQSGQKHDKSFVVCEYPQIERNTPSILKHMIATSRHYQRSMLVLATEFTPAYHNFMTHLVFRPTSEIGSVRFLRRTFPELKLDGDDILILDQTATPPRLYFFDETNIVREPFLVGSLRYWLAHYGAGINAHSCIPVGSETRAAYIAKRLYLLAVCRSLICGDLAETIMAYTERYVLCWGDLNYQE